MLRTNRGREVITSRLGIATGGEPYHDIRFALMAVVPDPRLALTRRLEMLRTNREIVVLALRQLMTLYQERKLLRSQVKVEPLDVKEEPVESEEEDIVVLGDSGTTAEAAKLAQEVLSALMDDTDLVKEMSNSVKAGTMNTLEDTSTPETEKEAAVEVTTSLTPAETNPVLKQNEETTVSEVKENNIPVAKEPKVLEVVPKVLANCTTEDYSDPRVKPNKSHVSKVISRCSSIDSQPTQPRSPFQSNPLLTAHDYAKSPLMEGLEEESNYDSQPTQPRSPFQS